MPLRTGDQTAGMLVMDAKLGTQHGPLARFIAERRTPGRGWRSREQIADELTELTGIQVTGSGVIKWAERLGIPMSEPDATDEQRREYLAAVEKYLRAPPG